MRTFQSLVLNLALDVAINAAAMYLMLLYFERNRRPSNLLLKSVVAVSPVLMVNVSAVVFAEYMTTTTYFALRPAVLIGVFLALLLIFKFDWKRSLPYAVGLFVVAQLTPPVSRLIAAQLHSMSGGGSATGSAAVPIALAIVCASALVWFVSNGCQRAQRNCRSANQPRGK